LELPTFKVREPKLAVKSNEPALTLALSPKERETGVAALENRALQLQSLPPHAFAEMRTTQEIRIHLAAPDVSPSPGGEGRGEGGRFSNCVIGLFVRQDGKFPLLIFTENFWM
jgi:hypothetical protein